MHYSRKVNAMEPPTNKKEKMLVYLVSLILISMALVAVVFLFFTMPGNPSEVDTTPKITTTYSGISADDAYDFINTTTHNLTIVDSRGCACRYNAGHIGAPPYFEAVHNINWKNYYDTEDDILVYDDYGNDESITFCSNLVNHTYGKILYLEGGFAAWSKANYPYV